MRFIKCTTLTSAATPPNFFCENYLLISILWWVDNERHYFCFGRIEENESFPINAHLIKYAYNNSTMDGYVQDVHQFLLSID